jgi:hypothetical protein
MATFSQTTRQNSSKSELGRLPISLFQNYCITGLIAGLQFLWLTRYLFNDALSTSEIQPEDGEEEEVMPLLKILELNYDLRIIS